MPIFVVRLCYESMIFLCRRQLELCRFCFWLDVNNNVNQIIIVYRMASIILTALVYLAPIEYIILLSPCPLLPFAAARYIQRISRTWKCRARIVLNFFIIITVTENKNDDRDRLQQLAVSKREKQNNWKTGW